MCLRSLGSLRVYAVPLMCIRRELERVMRGVPVADWKADCVASLVYLLFPMWFTGISEQ